MASQNLNFTNIPFIDQDMIPWRKRPKMSCLLNGLPNDAISRCNSTNPIELRSDQMGRHIFEHLFHGGEFDYLLNSISKPGFWSWECQEHQKKFTSYHPKYEIIFHLADDHGKFLQTLIKVHEEGSYGNMQNAINFLANTNMNFNTSHSLHKSLIFNPPLENSINKTHLELADEKFEHSIERKKHEITDPILFVDTIFKKEDDDDVNFKAEGFYTDDQQEIINKDLSANQELLRRDIKFLFSEIEVLKKDGKRKDKVIEKLELKLKESQKKEVNLLNEEENIVTTNLEANSEPERYSEPESEQEPCPVNVNINGIENPESIKESEQEIDSEPDSEEEPDPVINGNENPESVEESEQEIDSEPDSEEEPNAVDKNTMMNTISFSQKGNLRKHEKSIHKSTDGENSTDDKKPTESSDGQKSSESMDDENSTDSQKSPGDQEFNNSALKTPVSNTSLNKKMGYGRPKQVSAEKEMKKS